jgi:two-component system, LuxR family, response regulator FixJ
LYFREKNKGRQALLSVKAAIVRRYNIRPAFDLLKCGGLGFRQVPIQEYTVAIIEDEASFRRAIERSLRASGFKADAFASAEDFLASAEYAAHACLILDIHLPGMSGFDLLEYLLASRQALPAVLITGQDHSALRERASRIPNCVYLRKPFLRTVLLDALRSLVEHGSPSDR